MQEQFRRYDRIAGAVFVVLLVIGVITLSVTSQPKAPSQASPLGRATAAGPSRPATPAAAHATTRAPAPPPRPAATRTPPPPPTVPPRAAQAAPATHAAAPPPQTTAAAPPPPPPPPATHAAPAAPAGCTPKTNAGNCYQPGEFCRTADRGATGVAADGKKIKCEDNDGWRWEPI